MKIKFIPLVVIVSSVLLFSSCNNNSDETITQTPVSNFSGKIASDWMEIVRKTVKIENKNPPQASRIYGYNGVALYESLISGMSQNKSLAGQINGYPSATQAPSSEVDYPLVANEVLHELNKSLFGSGISSASSTRLDSIYSANLTERNAIIGNFKTNNSVSYGKQLADNIITYISSDNFVETRTMNYVVPVRDAQHPNFWAPTSPSVTMPAEPFWGAIRPISLASPEMSVPSEIPFDIIVGSPFYNQALEVYTTSQQLTQAQKNIALWWADGAGATATPPGHWVAIENQLRTNLNLNLQQAAEMYALVGIAMTDAFISCWYSKFKFNLLRPQTYIRDYIPGAQNWTPFLATPGFPEYPSGHSVCSGAGAEILTQLYGNQAFVDNTNASSSLNPRYYNSFNDAANEAAMSRVYGGIHFREASEKGLLQGKMIAQDLMIKIDLKK